MNYTGLSEEEEAQVVEISTLITEHKMAINDLVDQLASVIAPVLAATPLSDEALEELENQ